MIRKVLFVCTGNICRSPLAQGVFTQLVDAAGWHDKFIIDSAGTHAHFAGHSPDAHAQSVANSKGINISHYRSRPITITDYRYFDHILAADHHNMMFMNAMCQKDCRHKLSLLMHYASEDFPEEIPDPFGAGREEFVDVMDRIEAACRGLLASLSADLSS